MSYKALIGAKLLRITFDQVIALIRVCDGTRYLALFGPEKYDAIHNRIRLLISKKKMVLHMLFMLLIMQEPKLIHLILGV